MVPLHQGTSHDRVSPSVGKNKRGYMHCVAEILLARSALLRVGLRRKEEPSLCFLPQA
jgi:hypothetical protein